MQAKHLSGLMSELKGHTSCPGNKRARNLLGGDIHQSARCKEESKVHPDESKLCNAAPTNTYQTEKILLYVPNLGLTCELIHQKREQENDFGLWSFDLHPHHPPPPPPSRPSTLNKQPQCSVLCHLKDDVNIIGYICKRRCQGR